MYGTCNLFDSRWQHGSVDASPIHPISMADCHHIWRCSCELDTRRIAELDKKKRGVGKLV